MNSSEMLHLLVLISICGPFFVGADISPIVVNGRKAKLGELPYQVSIQVTNGTKKFSHFCGGSIIAPTWILTAGHCYSTAFDYRIVAGIVELNGTNPERQEIEVIKYIVHPKNFGPWNDVGLLQLAKPLKFNKFVKPIKLPKNGAKFIGKATGSGWGATDKIVTIHPNHLQIIELPILPASTCAKYSLIFLEKEHICTGPFDKGMCKGDSGGPLVQNGQIVGTVSFGNVPCANGSPSYYARVSSYIDFITKYVGKKEYNLF